MSRYEKFKSCTIFSGPYMESQTDRRTLTNKDLWISVAYKNYRYNGLIYGGDSIGVLSSRFFEEGTI